MIFRISYFLFPSLLFLYTEYYNIFLFELQVGFFKLGTGKTCNPWGRKTWVVITQVLRPHGLQVLKSGTEKISKI